jgi:acetolactate decarboxylase
MSDRDEELPDAAGTCSLRAMKKFLVVAWWCVCAAVAVAAERGTLTQWSTIDALLKGYYEGVATLGEVKQSGDFGLGTFEGLDGEMLLVDGVVYQIDSHGAVHKPGDAVRTPFAAVTFFKSDIELEIPAGLTLEQVQSQIDAVLPSKNVFYALRVTGRFQEMRTRSVHKQSEPYPPLSEVVKTQALFSLTKTEGTLAGLWCPSFAKSVNVPGFHFHYLAADRKSGGHVLGLLTGEGMRAQISVLREFSMKLPTATSFDALDLSGDRSKELHAVESERK